MLPFEETAERTALGSRLRRTAHHAIAEIQSRLPGATRGQLSLAAADAGQLSFAADEAGKLSFAPDSAGQLSLPQEQDSGRKERTSS